MSECETISIEPALPRWNKALLWNKIREVCDKADRPDEFRGQVENFLENNFHRLSRKMLAHFYLILKLALGPDKLMSKMLADASEAGKMTRARLRSARKSGLL